MLRHNDGFFTVVLYCVITVRLEILIKKLSLSMLYVSQEETLNESNKRHGF